MSGQTVCCGTCVFFKPWGGEGDSVHGAPGFCRRNAPKNNDPDQGFPSVFSIELCGEHKLSK